MVYFPEECGIYRCRCLILFLRNAFLLSRCITRPWYPSIMYSFFWFHIPSATSPTPSFPAFYTADIIHPYPHGPATTLPCGTSSRSPNTTSPVIQIIPSPFHVLIYPFRYFQESLLNILPTPRGGLHVQHHVVLFAPRFCFVNGHGSLICGF